MAVPPLPVSAEAPAPAPVVPAARPGQVPQATPFARRVCFAAVGLVAVTDTDDERPEVDWAASWALRRRLHDAGFPLAESLDLAQRERFGWEALERCLAERASRGLPAGFLFGAGAEHLPPAPSIPELVAGVVWQAQLIERAGGVPVLLPLVPLARRRASEREHVEVYRELLGRVNGPVLLERLGPGTTPALDGSFPGESFERVLEIDPAKVRGARVSRLAPNVVGRLRGTLPERGQILFVGDDPRFARTLAGRGRGASITELAGRSLALGDFAHGISGFVEPLLAPLTRLLARIEVGDEPDALELETLDGEMGRLLERS